MRRPPGNSSTWIAAVLSLFLVFVLPICWSGAMTRAFADRAQGPSNSNSNEEREEREQGEEITAARPAAQPPTEATLLVVETPRPLAHHDEEILASVAPKLHPSRFSERRLR